MTSTLLIQFSPFVLFDLQHCGRLNNVPTSPWDMSLSQSLEFVNILYYLKWQKWLCRCDQGKNLEVERLSYLCYSGVRLQKSL